MIKKRCFFFSDDLVRDSTVSTFSYDPWRETPDDSRKDEEYHQTFLEEKEKELEKGSLGATLDKGSLGTTLAALDGTYNAVNAGE